MDVGSGEKVGEREGGRGRVVFEQGPRNLRPSVPNGVITLDLVSWIFWLCFLGWRAEGVVLGF